MGTFIYGWITTLLVLLHMRLVGDVHYKIEYTNNDYNRTYVIQGNDCKETVVIKCREIKHSVKYKSWLLSKECFTYEVTLKHLSNTGTITDSSTATYPRLGSKIFPKSTYPHTRAVNAHLDTFFKKA